MIKTYRGYKIEVTRKDPYNIIPHEGSIPISWYWIISRVVDGKVCEGCVADDPENAHDIVQELKIFINEHLIKGR